MALCNIIIGLIKSISLIRFARHANEKYKRYIWMLIRYSVNVSYIMQYMIHVSGMDPAEIP